MPTNGFFIKPQKVKLLAGEQKATEDKPVHCLRNLLWEDFQCWLHVCYIGVGRRTFLEMNWFQQTRLASPETAGPYFLNNNSKKDRRIPGYRRDQQDSTAYCLASHLEWNGHEENHLFP